jgi:hypothetical protein
MKPDESERQLRNAIEEFETSLMTPIVSGELAAWSDQVRNSWTKLCPKIENQLSTLHPKQYQQIAKEDPELLSQVERMKAEDQAIEEQLQKLNHLIRRLTDVAPKAEPDERKATQPNSQLVDDGIALLNRMKKQEIAVRTWYMEAFNRDRGVAD